MLKTCNELTDAFYADCIARCLSGESLRLVRFRWDSSPRGIRVWYRFKGQREVPCPDDL